MENGLPYDVYIKVAELDKKIEATCYRFISVTDALSDEDLLFERDEKENLKMEPTEHDVALEKWAEKLANKEKTVECFVKRTLEALGKESETKFNAKVGLQEVSEDHRRALQMYQQFLLRVEVARESELKAEWYRLQQERLELLLAARKEQRAQFNEPDPKRPSGVRPMHSQ